MVKQERRLIRGWILIQESQGKRNLWSHKRDPSWEIQKRRKRCWNYYSFLYSLEWERRRIRNCC